ncbi:MAG TPA: DMT family transporter [Candidatus Limnocylindria bacterium]|nr:DMT family transporter [Candidatus Limnocylindria bacterium]
MSADAERMDPLGATFAALTAVLYGTSYVGTGIALASFGPLTVASLRGLLGLLALGVFLLLPVGIRWRQGLLPRSSWVRLLVLGIIGGPLFLASMNTAVSLSGATITSFVAGSYAVLAAALAIPLLRERLSLRIGLGLGLALLGTALLAELHARPDELRGIGWGLAAAVAFAVFLVLSRRWVSPYGLDSATVAITTLALTPLGAGAVALVAGERLPVAPEPAAVAAIAWLAIGPGAAAAMLVVGSMRRLSAARASAFLLLNPPVATLGGALLLGERLSPLQLVGALLVLVAIGTATGAWRLLAGLRP